MIVYKGRQEWKNDGTSICSICSYWFISSVSFLGFFLMGDFIGFIYVSNFINPTSLLVQSKQIRFSTNTSSEAKIAVFKVKQLRTGLEDKVCIIQEGSRKHWSEAVCEFSHSSV